MAVTTRAKSKTPEGSISDIVELRISVHEGYTHVLAVIRSRSRPGLLHTAQAYVTPQGVYKVSCDCEGFTFRKKCWHTELLKKLVQ